MDLSCKPLKKGLPGRCIPLAIDHIWFTFDLTLKSPIMTAADDKFCDIIPNFQQK